MNPNNVFRPAPVSLLALAVAAACAGPAGAADYDVTAHFGDTYTDNSLLAPFNEQSDNIGAVALKADIAAQGEHYDATVRTAATYLHYFRGTSDDDVLRGFDGELTLNLVPQRFLWRFQESYGPVLENPLAQDRPDNWTYDSYFTTGPDMQFGDTAGFHVITSARYGRADYENSRVPGNQQYSGRVSIAMPGTEHSENSLNLKAQRVEQENLPPITDGAEGYDSQEAYLRIANEMKRTSFVVELGASSLHDAGDSSTVPLVRAQVDRAITRHFTIALAVGSQYSDNLGRFSRLQGGDGSVNDPRRDVTPVTDPLEERFGDIALQYQSPRTDVGVRVRYNKLEYQHSQSDLAAQEYRSATFDARRQVTPRFSLELGGSLDRRQFGQVARSDDEYYGFLTAALRVRRDLGLQVTGRYEKRDSNDPLADYAEKSIQIELTYQLAQSDRQPRAKSRIGLY